MAKKTGKCIFCDRVGDLSGEHIFSRWTHRYLPTSTMKKYKSIKAVAYADRTAFKQFKKMGDIRHLKIYCVCQKHCNGGWMREEIDEAAKQILTKLIKGERTVITPDEQERIAAWAVLKLMVAEYENGDVTFHHTQRKRMMRKQLPPEHGCMVWIGHYKRGNWPPHWIRNTFLLLPDARVKGSKSRVATYFNSVVSTQVIGELFIHVVNCPKRDFAPKLYPGEMAKGMIVPIWPPTGQSVPWPARVTMRDSDADSLAGFVIRFLKKISGIPDS